MLPKANTPALLLDFESGGVCCYDHHLTRKFYMDFGVEMFNKVTLTYFTPLSSCGNCWTLFKGSNDKNRLQIYQNGV